MSLILLSISGMVGEQIQGYLNSINSCFSLILLCKGIERDADSNRNKIRKSKKEQEG